MGKVILQVSITVFFGRCQKICWTKTAQPPLEKLARMPMADGMFSVVFIAFSFLSVLANKMLQEFCFMPTTVSCGLENLLYYTFVVFAVVVFQ